MELITIHPNAQEFSVETRQSHSDKPIIRTAYRHEFADCGASKPRIQVIGHVEDLGAAKLAQVHRVLQR